MSSLTLKPSLPDEGKVMFEKYATRYRPGLDLVVKDIDIVIYPREKIGIVGRTGAGKSTITLSLFRLIEPAAGRIIIDNFDITTLGLHQLRKRLTIIPQDRVLFSGTLRFNLDPFSECDDTNCGHVWNMYILRLLLTLSEMIDDFW
jgi:ATP-binding cassette subfamily C (CFTR/MRP) protein 1